MRNLYKMIVRRSLSALKFLLWRRRITNIALIFTLIGVLVCQNIAYASDISCLRVPIGIDEDKTADIIEHLESKDDEEVKSYSDFFQDNVTIIESILLKIIRESDRKPSIYKELAFEIAALMLTFEDSTIINYAIFGFTYDTHRYEDYKIAMSITGLAVVMASRFNPLIVEFTRPQERKMNWNDTQRNFNRLVGFLREEQMTLSFLEILEKQKNDKREPWFIDSQIALLDAIEAIDYNSPDILNEAIERLRKLSKDLSVSSIVKDRLNEVTTVLESGGKKSSYKEIYENLISEFKTYKDNVAIKEMRFVKVIEDMESNVPKEDFGRPMFERDALEKYFGDFGSRRDPVDIYQTGGEYKKNEVKLKKALELVRIDYDDALKLIVDSSRASNQGVEDRIDSSVILLLGRIAGKWHFLLTKRAQGLTYEGVWGFSGGKKKKSDLNLMHTGLREFGEEMGFLLQKNDIVGPLQYEDTLDGKYRIFPFVAVIDRPVEFRPNRDEIEDEVWIPVEQISDEYITIHRGEQEIAIEVGEATNRILKRFAMVIPSVLHGDSASIKEKLNSIISNTDL